MDFVIGLSTSIIFALLACAFAPAVLLLNPNAPSHASPPSGSLDAMDIVYSPAAA